MIRLNYCCSPKHLLLTCSIIRAQQPTLGIAPPCPSLSLSPPLLLSYVPYHTYDIPIMAEAYFEGWGRKQRGRTSSPLILAKRR